jgi:hypothetical protein
MPVKHEEWRIEYDIFHMLAKRFHRRDIDVSSLTR